MPHPDILDQPEPLGRPLASALTLHGVVAAALLATNFIGHRRADQFGELTGGGLGSVSVSVVNQLPLPARPGLVNPVAHDTESAVPEPPAKTKPSPKVEAPDPTAIAIKSRNAAKRVSTAASAPNKYRAQQKDVPNQVYSQSGQAMVTPMVGQTGGGGIGVGTSSPFGTRFGYYAEILRTQVARNWKKDDIDPRVRNAPPAIVTFTIKRDGSVSAGSVKVVQRSGVASLDYSAQRAILDASPFPPLPDGFDRNEANIEFWFELKR